MGHKADFYKATDIKTKQGAFAMCNELGGEVVGDPQTQRDVILEQYPDFVSMDRACFWTDFKPGRGLNDGLGKVIRRDKGTGDPVTFPSGAVMRPTEGNGCVTYNAQHDYIRRDKCVGGRVCRAICLLPPDEGDKVRVTIMVVDSFSNGAITGLVPVGASDGESLPEIATDDNGESVYEDIDCGVSLNVSI